MSLDAASLCEEDTSIKSHKREYQADVPERHMESMAPAETQLHKLGGTGDMTCASAKRKKDACDSDLETTSSSVVKPRFSLASAIEENDYITAQSIIMRLDMFNDRTMDKLVFDFGGPRQAIDDLLKASASILRIDKNEAREDEIHLSKGRILCVVGILIPQILRMLDSSTIASIFSDLGEQEVVTFFELLLSRATATDNRFIYSVANIDFSTLLVRDDLRSFFKTKLKATYDDLGARPGYDTCFRVAMLFGYCPWVWKTLQSHDEYTEFISVFVGQLNHFPLLRYLFVNGVLSSETRLKLFSGLKFPSGQTNDILGACLTWKYLLRDLAGKFPGVREVEIVRAWVKLIRSVMEQENTLEFTTCGWNFIDTLSREFKFYAENIDMFRERCHFAETCPDVGLPVLVSALTRMALENPPADIFEHVALRKVLVDLGSRRRSAPILLVAFSLEVNDKDCLESLGVLARNPQDFVQSMTSWSGCWDLLYNLLAKPLPEEIQAPLLSKDFLERVLHDLGPEVDARTHENCAWYVQRQMKRFSKDNHVEGVKQWVDVFRASLNVYLQKDIVLGIFRDVPLGYGSDPVRPGHEAKTLCIAGIADHPEINRIFKPYTVSNLAASSSTSNFVGFRAIHESISLLRGMTPADRFKGFQQAAQYFQRTYGLPSDAREPNIAIRQYARALMDELLSLQLPTLSTEFHQAVIKSWRCFFYETTWKDESKQTPLGFIEREDFRAIRGILDQSTTETPRFVRDVVEYAYKYVAKHRYTTETLGRLGGCILGFLPTILESPVDLSMEVPLESYFRELKIVEIVQEYIREDSASLAKALYWSTFSDEQEQLCTQRPWIVDGLIELWHMPTISSEVDEQILKAITKESIRNMVAARCQEKTSLVLKLLERLGDGKTIVSGKSPAKCTILMNAIRKHIPVQHESPEIQQRARTLLARCLWAFIDDHISDDRVSLLVTSYMRVASSNVENYVHLVKVLLNSKVDEFVVAHLLRTGSDVRSYKRKYDSNRWGFWRLPLDLIKVLVLDYLRIFPDETASDDE